MDPRLTEAVLRIAEALERLAPPPPAAGRPGGGRRLRLAPGAAAARSRCPRVSRVAIGLLQGIERQKTPAAGQHAALRRAACRPTTPCCGAPAAWANPRWSRRRTPPPTRRAPGSLALIEIHREDIASLPDLLRRAARRSAAAA